MSKEPLAAFSQIENDIHFLILILEQIWKITHDGGDEKKRNETLRTKYKRGLMKIKVFLGTIPNPDDIIDYLECVKNDILIGVTDKAKTAIFKKLDLDFSVMLKKLEDEDKINQIQQNKAPEDYNPSDSRDVDEEKKQYTDTDLLRMVRDTAHIKEKAIQRNQAKRALNQLIQVIRSNDPEKLSKALDGKLLKPPHK